MRVRKFSIQRRRTRFSGMLSKRRLGPMFAVLIILAIPIVVMLVHRTPASASPCPCNAFSSPSGQNSFDDGTGLELGFKFKPDINGYITGVRFYKQGSVGTHTGTLWDNSGNNLASATFTETASGWQEVSFSSPVAVTAGTVYVASVSIPDGKYIATNNYFTSTVDNYPITLPSSSSVGGNGVYALGTGTFPTNTSNSTNYWVDVTFQGNQDSTPPTVTSVTPTVNATGVSVGEQLTVTFDENMLPSSIDSSTVVVKDNQNNTVSGTVNYNTSTKVATFDASDGLEQNKTYTVTLKGGTGSVIKNLEAVPLAADYTWSFTTGSDSCPCSLVDRAAAGDSQTSNDSAVELGVKIKPSENGFITAIRFLKPITSTLTTTTGKIWSSSGTQLATVTFSDLSDFGWQEAKLSAPLAVSKDKLYVISYTSDGHYAFSSTKLNSDLGGGAIKAFASGSSENAASGSSNGNGVFTYTAGTYPNGSAGGYYYWVDAVFTPYSSTVNPLSVDVTQPSSSSYGVPRSTGIYARFNRPLDASTVSGSSVHVTDASNNPVSGTVGYDTSTHGITFTPASTLGYTTKYTIKVDSTVKDIDGLALGSNYSWSFTTGSQLSSDPNSGPGGPILVITSSSDPYTKYYAEILRTEGLNYFDVKDLSAVSSSTLSSYKSVLLAEMPLTQNQADMFSAWVNGGGDLVAMRPDTKLANLLGITSAGTTRTNEYMLADTSTAPGKGITNQTIQYKGTADNYSLSGAAAVATLYSDASTSTSNPAVTYRSVGSKGGTAAAFSFDLAKSVIALHQGNQAWAGQERDGSTPTRSNDMFFGAKTGDVQPDWVDLNKVEIPQADEQQRLLANIITEAAKDNQPMPRFWYLPHDLKAAVVLAGDDHDQSNAVGTEHVFTNWMDYSGPTCSVMDWQCVRASGYVYTTSALTNSRAAQFVGQGFDIGDHPIDGQSGSCSNYGTYSNLGTMVLNSLTSFRAKFTSLPNQRTTRYHCYVWSDWDSQPRVDHDNGIRYDLNYVTYPSSWIGTRAAIITGSGMNMRFTDTTGSMLDVYQGVTNFENTVTPGSAITTVLDNAEGSNGYYGIFGTHYDMNDSYNTTLYTNTVSHSNTAMISSDQALTWLDGRGSSKFSNFSGSDGQYNFAISAAEGATGLRAMMPTADAAGTISSIKLAGSAVSYQTQVVKGVSYAVFDAAPGNYTVTYSDYSPSSGGSGGSSSSGGSNSSSTSSSGSKKVATRTNTGVFTNNQDGLGNAEEPNSGGPTEQPTTGGSKDNGRTIVEQSGSHGSSVGKWLAIIGAIIFVGGVFAGVVYARRRRPVNW